MTSRVCALCLLLSLATVARAEQPSLDPPHGAALPLGLHFADASGNATTIAQALDGKPAVLVFADWTCRAICGTSLGLALAALKQTGLRLGIDASLLAIGINPHDGSAQAAAMKAAYLPDNAGAAAHFLSGDRAAIDAATSAMGYRAVYLRDQDQYAHPAALMAIGPDGALRMVLPIFGLDPAALRSALTDPRPSGIGARILTFCNAALLSPHNAWVLPALSGAGIAAVLGMAAGFLALRRREARRS